ncbi:hypothetical protein [Nonomuraea sp. NEAU-A123]|uniref:DUF7196 family protein n=1 Tax=Nonomuraea sp. NEAU-A123 TaxID=2839649 RepID=UPI001BE4A36B|nr:hypothetical protein [Nonomuraea sp. NEAU-A123]MBT2226267.1 hypothetical protein [Nonomuraea sp. NEAU-A123]
MGCGCGKSASASRKKYKVTFNDGTTKTYMLQADAENARTTAGATRPIEVVKG